MTGLTDVVDVRIAPGVPATRRPAIGEWVSVVNTRARAFNIDRGKDDHELLRTSAGTATVVLNDRDRVMDPEYVSGPYHGYLEEGLWIELSYQGRPKFTGYVEDITGTWPSGPYAAGKGDAIVTITATDVFKVANVDLASYPGAVLDDSPSGYWRLNDLGAFQTNSGSQQDTGVVGTSFNLSAAAGATVIPGTAGGPLGSNQPVVEFSGASAVYPLSTTAIRNAGLLWQPQTFDMWLNPHSLVPGAGLASLYEYPPGWPGGNPQTPWALEIGASGAITMKWSSFTAGAFVSSSSPPGLLVTGEWQHVALVVNSTVLTWYRNGDFFGSSTISEPAHSGEFALNLAALVLGATTNIGLGYDGLMAHFAAYPTQLTSSRFVAHVTAKSEEIVEGYAGEQLTAICTAIGLDVGMQLFDVGSTLMQAFDPSGGSALDLMLHIAEDTEQGFLIGTEDGRFKFLDRNTLLARTSPVATFGDAGALGAGSGGFGVARYDVDTYQDAIITSSEVGYIDIEVERTGTDVRNLVSVTRTGGIEQIARDADSIAFKGTKPLSPLTDLAFALDVDAAGAAGYLLGRKHIPRQRLRTFTLMGSDANKKAQIAAREIADRITYVRRPPGGGTLTGDAEIEGVHHSWAVGQPWTTQYRCDLPLDVGSWTLGTDALDTTTTLGWGDTEPSGSDYLVPRAWSVGDRVGTGDFSILARRDPTFLKRTHAVRYYVPSSLIVPTVIGTPEIQRIKLFAGTATSGNFSLLREGPTQSGAMNFNATVAEVQSVLTFRPHLGQSFFGGAATVQVSQHSTPLNAAGIEILFLSNLNPPDVFSVDSSGLIGDSLQLAVTYSTFGTPPDPYLTLTSLHDTLSGGTFVMMFDSIPTAPIPWNADPTTIQAAIAAVLPLGMVFVVRATALTQAPNGLVDGYDIAVWGLGDFQTMSVINSIVGDTVSVIPIQNGDLSFSAPYMGSNDFGGRSMDTDAVGYPAHLGNVPGYWWMHGVWSISNDLQQASTDAILRRNGSEILAVGVAPPTAAFTGQVEVETIALMASGDFVELGFSNPNMAALIRRGSTYSYFEAYWMGIP